MMRFLTYTLMFLAFLDGPLKAEKGRYGADAVNLLGPGARAQGMGGAYTALADDATAAFWNPSGLPQIKRHQLFFSNLYLFDNLGNHLFLALAVPLPGKAAFAVSWTRVGIDNIPVYPELLGTTEERMRNPDLRSTGEPAGSFNDQEMISRLSFGKTLVLRYFTEQVELLPDPVKIHLGMNMNWYRQVLYDFSGDYTSLDAGFLATIGLNYSLFGETPNRDLNLGLLFQNLLHSDLVWNTPGEARDLVPRITRLGVSYKENLKQYNSVVLIAYQRDWEYAVTDHWGIEYAYNKLVYLRAGYGSRYWSAGTGFVVKGIGAGYTFKNHPLEPQHMVELSYDF